MIDRLLRIMTLAGKIAQAAGKGAGENGEMDDGRDWQTQLRNATQYLEHEVQLLNLEINSYDGAEL